MYLIFRFWLTFLYIFTRLEIRLNSWNKIYKPFFMNELYLCFYKNFLTLFNLINMFFKCLKLGCSKVTWTQNCLVIDLFGNKLKGVLLNFFSYIIVVSWKLISTIDLYILQTLKEIIWVIQTIPIWAKDAN